MRWWCVAGNAAQWPFGCNVCTSLDLLSMVCMDADRHRQTDRGRHRHVRNFHVADGEAPASKTCKCMTDYGRTKQERVEQGRSERHEVKPQKKPRQRR